jgi:hypothetical protein
MAPISDCSVAAGIGAGLGIVNLTELSRPGSACLHLLPLNQEDSSRRLRALHQATVKPNFGHFFSSCFSGRWCCDGRLDGGTASMSPCTVSLPSGALLSSSSFHATSTVSLSLTSTETGYIVGHTIDPVCRLAGNSPRRRHGVTPLPLATLVLSASSTGCKYQASSSGCRGPSCFTRVQGMSKPSARSLFTMLVAAGHQQLLSSACEP